MSWLRSLLGTRSFGTPSSIDYHISIEAEDGPISVIESGILVVCQNIDPEVPCPPWRSNKNVHRLTRHGVHVLVTLGATP